jgi:hypothetical protein
MREIRMSGLRRGEAAAVLPLSYSTSIRGCADLAAALDMHGRLWRLRVATRTVRQ